VRDARRGGDHPGRLADGEKADVVGLLDDDDEVAGRADPAQQRHVRPRVDLPARQEDETGPWRSTRGQDDSRRGRLGSDIRVTRYGGDRIPRGGQRNQIADRAEHDDGDERPRDPPDDRAGAVPARAGGYLLLPSGHEQQQAPRRIPRSA
jgi:hypothetical protein